MKQEETIDFHIRRTWHRIMRLYNYEAAKQDATMSMAYTLLNIDIDHGTPSTSLGPQMGMESRSLTRMLKKMEEEGVIKRVADKNDKRITRICLTKKGIEKRDQSRLAVIRLNKAIQTNLTKKERTDFFNIMNKINKSIETKHIFD
jgi:DNA-binding MarR family transcriptional regulator